MADKPAYHILLTMLIRLNLANFGVSQIAGLVPELRQPQSQFTKISYKFLINTNTNIHIEFQISFQKYSEHLEGKGNLISRFFKCFYS